MNISLTPQLEEFVRRKVESGRYGSSSEVICEALRLLEQAELNEAQRLEALRADIQGGLDQLDRGESVDGDILFARLRRTLERSEP